MPRVSTALGLALSLEFFCKEDEDCQNLCSLKNVLHMKSTDFEVRQMKVFVLALSLASYVEI